MLTSKPALHLPVNRKGRDWFVGDIRGQVALFKALLDAVGFHGSRDRIIATGNLIDGGTGSVEIFRLLADQPWFYSVAGYHEALMVAARNSPTTQEVWEDQGGTWARCLEPEDADVLRAWAHALPVVIQVDQPDGTSVGVVSAEPPAAVSWIDVIQQARPIGVINPLVGGFTQSLLTAKVRTRALDQVIRDPQGRTVGQLVRPWLGNLLAPIPDIDRVVCGFNPVPTPLICGNTVWLNTSAENAAGSLSAVCGMGEAVYAVREPKSPRLVGGGRLLTLHRVEVTDAFQGPAHEIDGRLHNPDAHFPGDLELI